MPAQNHELRSVKPQSSMKAVLEWNVQNIFAQIEEGLAILGPEKVQLLVLHCYIAYSAKTCDCSHGNV